MTISSLQLHNTLIADRYLVGTNLKQGSYAEIYEAFDRQQQCTVIIKALNTHLRGVPDRLLEETLIKNFQQECDVQELLRHPHIVELLDDGTAINHDGVSFRYLVLEYLSGGDLQSHCKDNFLSLREVLYYFGQVVPALAVAHNRNIIHRDLKPANFLLSADKRVIKIADFGVARLVFKNERHLITRVGTPIYSPPEHNPDLQSNFDRLTPASDVYSLAKTIYAALTGKAPSQFRAKPIEVLPPPLDQQPWAPKLLRVLRQATADDSAERYQSIFHFWNDLSTVNDVAGSAPALPRTRNRFVIELSSFKTRILDLVNINDSGKVVARARGEARYLVEEFGNGTPIEMMLIPKGRFLMGSSKDELERCDCEGPQHWVDIESFLLGRFPVTQHQWREVARLPVVKHQLDLDPSTFKGECLPVETVSWDEAVEFCQRLTRVTKRRYRLPSESEWEYACRAGSLNPFCFGDTILPTLANFDSTLPYKRAKKSAARDVTVAVDELSTPNAFGVIGTHGNVWEWCLDTWHENYNGAPVDGRAWTRDGAEDLRVVRGGSWFNAAWLCRSAYRYAFETQMKGHNCGFRLAAEIQR